MLTVGDFTTWDLIPGLEIIITLKRDNISFNVIIGESVGYGGTKRAYKITDSSVILLPSSGLGINETYYTWKIITDEEVKASKFLTSIGLHNPKHEDVNFIPQLNITIKSYMSVSFDEFARCGMYLMDLNNNAGIPHVFFLI